MLRISSVADNVPFRAMVDVHSPFVGGRIRIVVGVHIPLVDSRIRIVGLQNQLVAIHMGVVELMVGSRIRVVSVHIHVVSVRELVDQSVHVHERHVVQTPVL